MAPGWPLLVCYSLQLRYWGTLSPPHTRPASPRMHLCGALNRDRCFDLTFPFDLFCFAPGHTTTNQDAAPGPSDLPLTACVCVYLSLRACVCVCVSRVCVFECVKLIEIARDIKVMSLSAFDEGFSFFVYVCVFVWERERMWLSAFVNSANMN